jgi:hypothetical protein
MTRRAGCAEVELDSDGSTGQALLELIRNIFEGMGHDQARGACLLERISSQTL